MIKKFRKYAGLAEHMASLSKDPRTKVGAIALDDEFGILSAGYNGFPRGVFDNPQLLLDRVEKHKRVVHAEENVVAQAARAGVSLKGCTVIVSGLFPCSRCAGLLIQAGVKRVVCFGRVSPDWSGDVAQELFKEAGVEVITA